MSNQRYYNYQHPTKIQLGKKHFFMAITGSAMISIAGITWVLTNRTGFKSIDITKTAEYHAVVSEHIDLSQVTKQEVGQTATLENLSQRFGAYRFNHSKLRGKWGDLYVLVDRQTNKTASRSLLPVNSQPPIISIQGDCLQIPQARDGLIEKYKICIR